MTTLPFPCPVRLGVMKSEGLEEQLHRYTMEKNLTKMEKLLRKGRLLFKLSATNTINMDVLC